jgi:asparagine synthase (glutamine-hydrolysing)
VTALAGFWAGATGADPLSACDRMLKAQAAYGPAPPVRLSCGPDLALGRRLYSFLPEDRFDRGPVTGGGGRWTLVADLRLDNRDELADTLGLGTGECARLSDSALLMRAIERWEGSAVERLVGVFAFALWDREREELLLARDFAGQRPLHFHRGSGFFAFASMAKGLHALPDVPVGPDEGAMKRFLALLPQKETASFFAGVERVPPGHVCIVRRGGEASLRRYWSPEPRTLRLPRAEDYEEALREQFDRAVAAQLRGTERGVATHLSGGLDSSAVTATAARLLGSGRRVSAFTAAPRKGFDDRLPFGRFADESAHAAAVAALYPNIEHVLIRSGGQSPLAALDRNAFLYERPVLNLCNAVWSDAIHAAAKDRGLSVLLIGQMGNMTFSYTGFEHLTDLLARGRWLRLAREALALRRQGFRLRSAAAHALGPYLPARLWAAIGRWRGRDLDLTAHSVLDPAAAEAVRAEAAAEGFDFSYRPRRDGRAMRLWVIGRVDSGNYNKGIVGGWGIDMRDPTGDQRLVELCLSIPAQQYLRGGRIRALARAAFADRLPELVTGETRKGLQAADWYDGFLADRGSAVDEVERLARLAPAAGLIDVDRMRALLADCPAGGWNMPRVQTAYRLALLRGISSGHFLRKASGAN